MKKKKEKEKNIQKEAKKVEDHEKNQHDQAQSTNYDEERAKKYYVIFTGPNKGIYDHWSKAAPFIVGHNVTHKSFLSLQEAKNKFEEYKQSYVAQLQRPAAEAARISKGKMVTLGTIPRIPTIS